MKSTWKDYFSFNKRQRNGLLVLISLISLLIIYLIIGDYFPISDKLVDFKQFKSDIQEAGIKTPNLNANNSINTSLIEINSADTALLMTLPGMTSYCAGMLVKYRKKLGGYYSIKQLTEVWGMDSIIYKAMVNKVWADTGLVHKININNADIKQLAYQPYIRYYLAKAIVNFRQEHGLFSSLGDLHKMVAIDDSTYLRIVPYLTIGNK